ncbi:MAG: hypothetical protein MUF60_10045 [Vicinamibacterales bacterium]|nr:hypothetical protein [Vicinamibacterales bacterium]
MTRKAVALVAWLATGHVAMLGLFWGLLNVPESNVAMLALSAAILCLWLAVGALVEGTAGAWLLPGRSFREAIHAGVSSLSAFVVALAVFGAFWWLGGVLDAWHESYRGQIDAWVIATFDTPEATWPHRAIDVAVFLAAGVLGVSAAVAVFFARLEGGTRAMFRPSWVRAALSRDQVTLVALGLTLFVALPWQFVSWRPEGLPPTWVQPAFAAAKLALIYLSMNVGWLICLLAGARHATARG